MVVKNLDYKSDNPDSLSEVDVSSGGQGPSTDQIKDLLEKNNEMLGEILKNSKKMNRFIIGQQVFGVIKILIFVIPIIIGIIYLPPLINELMVPYRELMNLGENASGLSTQLEALDGLDSSILDRFLK